MSKGMILGLLILAAFAIYGLYYYVSNRTVDPYTGEKVLIDKNIDAAQEEAVPAEMAAAPRPLYAGPRVGRNDPCPCGSGKKYKQCHGKLS